MSMTTDPQVEELKKLAASVPRPIPWWVPDTRTGIVYWMMVSSFIIITTLIFKPPTGDNTLLNTLLGMYIGTGLIGAIQYWTGNSRGSDVKTDALIANQQTGISK